MKIWVKTNCYWFNKESLYLDTFSYETNKIVSFEKFEYDFYPNYINGYDYEWKGNNPFSKDEVLRLWVSENARVEIFVNDRKDGTTFEIYKVLNSYKTANELLLDLAKVNLLYDDVLKWFKQYVKDYELEEANDEEYEQEPTIMVENPKVWKDDLEKIENDLCAEMTEEQFKAYKYGIELFYSWIKQTVDAHYKNGWVTVLTPNEDVTPQECTLDEFVKCKYFE